MMRKLKEIFCVGIMTAVFVVCGSVSYAEPEAVTVPTPIIQAQTQEEEETVEEVKESGKMSTGGVILTVLLGIIINTGISFWISNRFYKMSKKDSHLQSEIRALRRDLDDKLSGNIKEIKESRAVVKNTNKSMAKKGEITYTPEPPADEIQEIAKKWNIKLEGEEEPEVKIRPSKKLQTREDVVPKAKKEDGPIKNRAKEILGDIFPFNDEE